MRTLITFLLFGFSFLYSTAQRIDESIIQLHLNDTLFIDHHYSDNDYHCIFLDTNRNSENFKKIYSTYKDIGTIQTEAKDFKKENELITKKVPSYLVQTWRVLHLKNQRFYNYLPGDWCGFFEFTIPNQGLLLDGWCDGTMGTLVKDYELINRRIHHITGYMVGMINKTTHHYLVKVDMKNGIYALFNDLSEMSPEEIMNSTNYRLIIPRQFIRKFPLIVNYSKYNKPLEYRFDQNLPLCEWFKICR